MNIGRINIYSIILLIETASFALVNRLSIPYELYYYITKINSELLSDPLTYSFQLLKTPSYVFLEFFYDNPLLFFWSSFIINIIFSLIIFELLYSLNKNSLISLIVLFIFSPLSLAIFTKLFFDPSFRVIHVFGYGSYIFSTRYILGIFSIFSIYFLIKKKINLALIFYSLSLMSHPSSGLLSGLFLITTFFIIKLNLKYYINFLFFSFIGLIPILNKLLRVNNLYPSSEILSKKDWYLRLIHDEPDDFSILFQLDVNFFEIIFVLFLIIFVSYLIYKNIHIDKIVKKIFYCQLSLPIVFFFIFAAIEYLSISFNNFILIDPIIKTQAGYKILKYSYFPLVFSFGFLLANKLKNVQYDINKLIFIRSLIFLLFLFLPLFLYSYMPKNFQNKITLHNNLKNIKKNNYIDFLNATSFKYGIDPYSHEKYFLNIIKEKPLYIQNELNIAKLNKYKKDLNKLPKFIDAKSKKYSTNESFNNLIDIIKKYIPKKSSIIVLPYFLYVRDILPNYNFYYLEKPDANLALGSRIVASLISERLKDLINVDHKELHLQSSGYLYSDLRRRYLKIDDDKLNFLKKKYPEYKYFITESGHYLNLKKIYEDSFYIIYGL